MAVIAGGMLSGPGWGRLSRWRVAVVDRGARGRVRRRAEGNGGEGALTHSLRSRFLGV